MAKKKAGFSVICKGVETAYETEQEAKRAADRVSRETRQPAVVMSGGEEISRAWANRTNR